MLPVTTTSVHGSRKSRSSRHREGTSHAAGPPSMLHALAPRCVRHGWTSARPHPEHAGRARAREGGDFATFLRKVRNIPPSIPRQAAARAANPPAARHAPAPQCVGGGPTFMRPNPASTQQARGREREDIQKGGGRRWVGSVGVEKWIHLEALPSCRACSGEACTMSNELFSTSYAGVMRIDRRSPACVGGDTSSEPAASREIDTVNTAPP